MQLKEGTDMWHRHRLIELEQDIIDAVVYWKRLYNKPDTGNDDNEFLEQAAFTRMCERIEALLSHLDEKEKG